MAGAGIATLIVLGSGLLGVWIARRVAPRVGIDVAGMSAARKRRIWLMLAIAVVPGIVVLWLFSTGHAAIGVGVLIAVFILPEFVLVPLRITRSRRAADASRARRESRRDS